MALNGYINLEVTQPNKMPSFFGPFEPRKKIPAGDSKNQGSPGGIEPTSNVATLYRTSSKSVFSFNTTSTINPAAIKANPSLYVELYVLGAEYGYETDGTDTYAKFYQRFYPISSVLRKVTVSGVARNEYEYEDLAWWIRLAQSDLAKGNLDSIGLFIPGAAVNAFGIIPKFSFKLGEGVGEQPNPIPFAIPYQFDFVILQDTTDPVQNNFGDALTPSNSKALVAYQAQYWIQNNDYQEYTSKMNAANRTAQITVDYGNGITS